MNGPRCIVHLFILLIAFQSLSGQDTPRYDGSLRRWKDHDSAINKLNALLRHSANRDDIFHNIANLYLEQGRDSLALVYLQKVRYDNQKKFNDLGAAYTRLNRIDSALVYFRKASDVNTEVNGSRKNIQYAITCKNLGDYFSSIENYDSALIKYQQAIIQLVFDFDEQDIRLNPVTFNGQYSVNELFGALSSKARTFTGRFQKQYNKNDLLSAIYAYEALYKLADYIIRSYEPEDAKLLLSNRKHLWHNEPIEICLRLFEETNDEVYLRHAFRFDEKSKATILALQLPQMRLKQHEELPAKLTEKEKRLTEEIAKLQLPLSRTDDSAAQIKLRQLQVELSDLHQKFEQYPGYNRLRIIDNTIDIKTLQRIIPDDYAVLSYHLGDTIILGFVITAGKFLHVTNKIDSNFKVTLGKFYKLMQVTDQNVSEQMHQLSDSLYKKLIQPFLAEIEDVKHLMIIPDDKLLYLPFEILGQRDKSPILKHYSFTYNYACSLLLPTAGVNLSACETLTDQQVKEEGLIGLTSALSYAGCNNTITRLWAADNESTAEINSLFNNYIRNGRSYASSLQKAKIDFLEELPETRRFPANWAHLRLIGTFQKEQSKNNMILVAVAVLILTSAIIYFSRRIRSFRRPVK
jgi:CHAT domain-containing protein